MSTTSRGFSQYYKVLNTVASVNAILAGKCDSRRHSTTIFNENVVDYRRWGREKVITGSGYG